MEEGFSLHCIIATPLYAYERFMERGSLTEVNVHKKSFKTKFPNYEMWQEGKGITMLNLNLI